MGAGIIINIDRIIINTDNRPVTKLYKNSYIKKEKPIEKQTKGIHGKPEGNKNMESNVREMQIKTTVKYHFLLT